MLRNRHISAIVIYTATIIDNILTNTSDDLIKTNILVTDITDHFPTVLYKQLHNLKKHKNEGNKYVYKRIHSDVNIDRFKNNLSCVDWNNILHGNDVNTDYTNFTRKFIEVYDECIPLKKTRTNRKKTAISPWITNGLLKSINYKNKLYKKYLMNPTEDIKQEFKTYRNKLNSLIRKCKREYYYKKFENTKNSIRKTWKTINALIGKGKSDREQCTFQTDKGDQVTDPKQIADSFNEFFVNIGPQLASKICHSGKNYFEYLKNPNVKCMFMKPVIAEEVVKIINKFDQNKSPGNDGIGNFIVKKGCSSNI